MVKDEAWRTGLRRVLHRNLTEFAVSLHTMANGLMSTKNDRKCVQIMMKSKLFMSHVTPGL